MKFIGSDELIYQTQAESVRKAGIRALRVMAQRFVSIPDLAQYPSPLRWLWLMLMAVFGDRTVPIASWVAIGPVTAWAVCPSLGWRSIAAGLLAWVSPLVTSLSRRILQDVPVALVTMAAIGFVLRHSSPGLALCAAALLCMKEGAVFTVPALAVAWIVSGGDWILGAVSLAASGIIWLASLTALYGRMLPDMFSVARTGHDTEYTRDHQRGAPHRLVADLMMTSPAVVLCAVHGLSSALPLFSAAAVLIISHAVAPIRNVRLIVAADVLLCAVTAASVPIYVFPFLVLVSLYIAWKIRDVYDPVSVELFNAFQ